MGILRRLFGRTRVNETASTPAQVDPHALIVHLTGIMRDWDQDWRTRENAANQLKQLGWTAEADDETIAFWLLLGQKGYGPTCGTESVPYLLRAIASPTRIPEEVLLWVCNRLGWLKDPRCVEPLIQTLRVRYDFPSHVRTAIVGALAAMPDSRVISFLLECLSRRAKDTEYSQPASDEVDKIAPVLAEWKCAEAVPLLITRLKRELGSVIIKALGELQDPRATPALTEIMRKKKTYIREDDSIQVLAAIALHKIGDESTVRRTPFAENYNNACVFFYDRPDSDLDGDPTSGCLRCRLKDIQVTFFKQSSRQPEGIVDFCKGCTESRA